MTGRWTRTLVGIAAVVLLATGCDSSTPRASDPIDPVAVATVPARPFVPTQLPEGWTITYRSVEHGVMPSDRSLDTMSQFLYLPPDGSPSSGPAVLVGYITDDQSAPLPCAGEEPADSEARERRQRRRHLSVVEIDGPDGVGANAAYVIGRDVKDSTVDRALRAFRWDRPGALTPGQDLGLRAGSRLPASGVPALAQMVVGTSAIGAAHRVSILQEDGNAAERAVARFWQSIEGVSRCRNESATRTMFRGRTIVRFLARDAASTRLGVDVIEPGLRRIPVSDFEAG